MQIVTPQEAIQYLLNRERSGPIVSLDTEFDASVPTCRAPLHGMSMAGGTPATGYQGAFWSFRQGFTTHEFGYLREKLLAPIFSDPTREVVMHPPKVDMQLLEPRGLTNVQAKIRCTMSLAQIYDENLPKGLKELAHALLHIPTKTYSVMEKERKGLLKEGEKLVKEILREAWEVYKQFRKPKDAPLEAVIDPTWPSWQRLTMKLPPKLTKGEVEQRLGVVHNVVMTDYASRAHAIFSEYGAKDALLTLALWYFMSADLPAALWPLVEIEEAVCHPIVTRMEQRGLCVDTQRLRVIHDAMQTALTGLRADVIERWGVKVEEATADKEGDFNPGSPDQVQKKLWLDWELSPPPWAKANDEIKPKYRAGKFGLCTTNKDVMAWLADNAPEPYRTNVAKLMEFRSYDKLFGTFVRPNLERAEADPEHRLHPSTWPVGARTDRFTQDDPNCENIPRPSTMPKMVIPNGVDPYKPPPGFVVWKNKKTDEKKWQVDSLRQTFIAPPGMKLVSIDLSQIENRLMAHESRDPMLLWIYRGWDCGDCGKSGETDQPLHACPNCNSKDGKRDKLHPDQPVICNEKNVGKRFCLGRDIHSFTSVAAGYAEKFGPEEGRERGKTLNHSFSYGMGAATKARRDKETVKEAQAGLDAMRVRYPRVPEMQNSTKIQVRERGQVETFDGYIRRFKVARLLMASGNFQEWEWEGVIREAVNVKAQGGTGRIMKRAMITIAKKIAEKAKTDPRWRNVHLVNQVHDELLFEAPDDIADDVKNLVVWELEHAVQLAVPVIADGKTGRTWGEAH